MLRQTRYRSHALWLESLEDRYLPSVTTSPLDKQDLPTEGCVDTSHQQTEASERSTGSALSKEIDTSTSTEKLQAADTAFTTPNLYAPPPPTVMVAVGVVKTSYSTQFYEMILVPITLSRVQPKVRAATTSATTSDSDSVVNAAVSTVAASVVANRTRTNTPEPTAREIVNSTNTVAAAQDTSRTAQQVPVNSAPLATNLLALEASRATRTLNESAPSAVAKLDAFAEEPVVKSEQPGSAGVVTAEPSTRYSSSTASSQALLTEENPSVFTEIEQALQSLAEPLGVKLQALEPSLVWVFISSWLAAAAIAYEYLRRKHQWTTWNVESWLEGHALAIRPRS